MLVIRRRLGEKIVIEHGRITITVTDIDRGYVRLAFDADPAIAINREEVELELDHKDSRRTDNE